MSEDMVPLSILIPPTLKEIIAETAKRTGREVGPLVRFILSNVKWDEIK